MTERDGTASHRKGASNLTHLTPHDTVSMSGGVTHGRQPSTGGPLSPSHHTPHHSHTTSAASVISPVEVAALRAELEESQSARKALEVQLDSLVSSQQATIQQLNNKHASELAELQRSLKQQHKDALQQAERDFLERMKKSEGQEELFALKAAVETKDHQIQLLNQKYENQSNELSAANTTAHRLQTAVDLINRQIMFSEDYKTILKHVTCKLYAVLYRSYKSSREAHQACSDLIKNVNEQEKRVWKEHHQSFNTEVGISSNSALQSQANTAPSTPLIGSVNPKASHVPPAAFSLTVTPASRTTSPQKQPAPNPPMMPSSTSDFVLSSTLAPSAIDTSTRTNGQQNEIIEWVQHDRQLWSQEKSMFQSAAAARKERSEKIEYKLQYHVQSRALMSPVGSPTAASSSSSSTSSSLPMSPSHHSSGVTTASANEYRRLRALEKRRRALEEGESRRTGNLFSYWWKKRANLVLEALPILTIAMNESFERERTSFQTTKLFQQKNTELMLEYGTLQSEQRALQKQLAKTKKRLEVMQQELSEARSKMCVCTTISSMMNGGGDQATNLCLCECVEDCNCAKKEKERQEQQQQQQQSQRIDSLPEEKESDLISPAPIPTDQPSSSIYSFETPIRPTHPPPSQPDSSSMTHSQSLSELTPRFTTALGSGRNGRTHALLNERSNHLSHESSSPSRTMNQSASTGALNATIPIQSSASKDDTQSVPFLQRTIKNLRSRLHVARSAILTLQNERNHKDQKEDHSADQPSQHPQPHQQQHEQTHSQFSSAQRLPVYNPRSHHTIQRFASHGDEKQEPIFLGFGSRSSRFDGLASASHVSSYASLPPPPASANLSNLAQPSATSTGVPLSSSTRSELKAGLESDLSELHSKATTARREYKSIGSKVMAHSNDAKKSTASKSKRSSLPFNLFEQLDGGQPPTAPSFSGPALPISKHHLNRSYGNKPATTRQVHRLPAHPPSSLTTRSESNGDSSVKLYTISTHTGDSVESVTDAAPNTVSTTVPTTNNPSTQQMIHIQPAIRPSESGLSRPSIPTDNSTVTTSDSSRRPNETTTSSTPRSKRRIRSPPTLLSPFSHPLPPPTIP